MGNRVFKNINYQLLVRVNYNSVIMLDFSPEIIDKGLDYISKSLPDDMSWQAKATIDLLNSILNNAKDNA